MWSPCPIVSKSGFCYLVTFVDDYSIVTWLYFIKNHSNLFEIFCAFHAKILNQFHTSIHNLQSDNAKEYFSTLFSSYLSQHGIMHQSSCVVTPQQNAVTEWKNPHLMEVSRALLFQMKVPRVSWAKAISTTCFLIICMPSLVLNG